MGIDRSAASPDGRRNARRFGACLGAVSLAAAAMAADGGFDSAVAYGQEAPPNKGPVGWDTYRDLGSMPRLRGNEQSVQESSYDRTGGNNDGFEGTYSCLRTSDQGCVLAEHTGAGEITSIWSTREPLGDVTATGNIIVELDGRTVLNAPFADVVSGRLGAPFAWPLVGNGADTVGGAALKVPMPYRESMRVTVQNNPYFYHVDYRTFPDANGVRTFDPAEQATDVLDKLRAFGLTDPKGSPGTPQRMDFDLPPGQSITLAQLSGPARINQLRLRLPQVVAAPQVIDDGRAFGVGGGSHFRMRVNPDNQGIRVIRRFDPQVADQVGSLLVDGVAVGEWRSGAAAPGLWGVQIIDVPASVTAGKSWVDIDNRFVSSSLDVNEFRYDVHSMVGGEWVRSDVLDMGPSHPGEESAHSYRIDNPVFERWQLSGRYPTPADQVIASDAVLEGARLRITFDDQTTVDSPVGEFFGTGLGEYDVRSMMSSVDPGLDGWYTAWWPMPFNRTATVELINDSTVPITGATGEVATGAGGVDANSGYFHATHHSGTTVPGQDWNFLSAQGAGTFYGVTHSMRGLIPPDAAARSGELYSQFYPPRGRQLRPQQDKEEQPLAVNQRNYLEGDERFYVDGASAPAWHGTGTEDFYESGWYFRFGTTFSMPQNGSPAYEVVQDGCQFDCTGAYRYLLNDAVPFRNGFVAGIEHGPINDELGLYSSTAYWYGGIAAQRMTGLPPVPTGPAPTEVPSLPPEPPASQTPAPPESSANTPETSVSTPVDDQQHGLGGVVGRLLGPLR